MPGLDPGISFPREQDRRIKVRNDALIRLGLRVERADHPPSPSGKAEIKALPWPCFPQA